MIQRSFLSNILLAVVFSMGCFLLLPNSLSAQQTPVQPEEPVAPVRRFSGVDVSGDTEICEGSQTTLKVEGEYESYLWSNGSTERSITIEKPGIYEVTVKTKGGCTFTTGVNVRTKLCT
jgi:hypothetical protein